MRRSTEPFLYNHKKSAKSFVNKYSCPDFKNLNFSKISLLVSTVLFPTFLLATLSSSPVIFVNFFLHRSINIGYPRRHYNRIRVVLVSKIIYNLDKNQHSNKFEELIQHSSNKRSSIAAHRSDSFRKKTKKNDNQK